MIQETSQTIRVVLAVGQPIVRSGIRAELEAAADVLVMGEVVAPDPILSQVSTIESDVLILDVDMSGIQVATLLPGLVALPSGPAVLMLTAEPDAGSITAILQAGAAGCWTRQDDSRSIVEGVRAVFGGNVWLSENAVHVLLQDNAGSMPGASFLTARELDVLRLAAQGKYNDQIAAALGIGEGTVRNHITSLYEKLRVHSRAELVAYAWQNGLVD